LSDKERDDSDSDFKLSRDLHFAAYRVGVRDAEERQMDIAKKTDHEIQKIGGDDLKGSGFEAETPDVDFDQNVTPALEGFLP
jgi:hypothetical protein